MQLFFTDEQFKKSGVSLPGIPFLANDQAELVEPANRFLFHIAAVRGRTRSEVTWRTYADHLYDFFSFLEENELGWDVVISTHLAAWRNGMLERGVQRSTCNHRIRTVAAFYSWCMRMEMITNVPFHTDEIFVPRPKGFMAHVNATGNKINANELTLPSVRSLPKFLNLDQAYTFIQTLSPERTQLVAWLMLLCGLRREEAAGLDIRVLPTPAGHDPKKSIRMTLDPSLTPTKGSRERWVNLPYPLAGHLHDYLMRDRPPLARAFKKKYGYHSTKLFLSQLGEELSLDGLDYQFRLASSACGIKCHPHMLRHSFAVYELIRMSGKPGINALTWVQKRLGHASITTTQIYVDAADLVNHDEIDVQVMELLEKMASGNVG